MPGAGLLEGFPPNPVLLRANARNNFFNRDYWLEEIGGEEEEETGAWAATHIIVGLAAVRVQQEVRPAAALRRRARSEQQRPPPAHSFNFRPRNRTHRRNRTQQRDRTHQRTCSAPQPYCAVCRKWISRKITWQRAKVTGLPQKLQAGPIY